MIFKFNDIVEPFLKIANNYHVFLQTQITQHYKSKKKKIERIFIKKFRPLKKIIFKSMKFKVKSINRDSHKPKMNALKQQTLNNWEKIKINIFPD